MSKLILESIGILKNRIIEGYALTPTVSGNGNIYTAEEIDAAKGLNVPLYANWEHTKETIGSVVYSLIPESHSLFYRATITNDKRALEIKEGIHKVSIEADVNEIVKSCTKTRCYNMPVGLTMEGIGITTSPGVQTATLNIIESHQDWPSLKESHCNDCKEMDHGDECPEGQVMKDGKCVTKEDVMGDCIKKMMDHGKDHDQAIAICTKEKESYDDLKKEIEVLKKALSCPKCGLIKKP